MKECSHFFSSPIIASVSVSSLSVNDSSRDVANDPSERDIVDPDDRGPAYVALKSHSGEDFSQMRFIQIDAVHS